MFHIINWSIFMNQKSSKLFLWVIFFLVVPQPQMNSMYNDITIVDAEPTFDLTFGNIAIGAAKMGGILLGTAALNALVGYSTQRLASYMQKIDPTRSKVESKIQTIKKKGSFVPKHTPVWNWMKFIKGNKTSPEGWKSLLSFEKDKIDPFGVEDIKGFLLYGDPGVGKTALAKAFAYEIGAPFKEISATNFTTRVLVGTGVLGVQDFFDEVEKVASEHGEIVVLIDEADSLFKRVENEHNHYDNSANNELLKRIDNLHKGVRLFFATNNINNMDRALYRDGRIVPLKVEHPDLKNRLKALKFHATDGRCIYSSAFDFLTILADFTDNFTFAELGELVKDASRYAGQMSYETGARAITQESLRKALLNRFLSKRSIQATETNPPMRV